MQHVFIIFTPLSPTGFKVLSTDTKVFKRHYENGHVIEYVDIGKQGVISLLELIRDKNKYVDGEGFFTVRCKLTALPSPVVPSPDHDSKAMTGMVGLENLGATCYLNALLQVRGLLHLLCSPLLSSAVLCSAAALCSAVLCSALLLYSLCCTLSFTM